MKWISSISCCQWIISLATEEKQLHGLDYTAKTVSDTGAREGAREALTDVASAWQNKYNRYNKAHSVARAGLAVAASQ